MRAVYDAIGTGYVAHRQADPRVARSIRAALSADLGYRLVVAEVSAPDRRRP